MEKIIEAKRLFLPVIYSKMKRYRDWDFKPIFYYPERGTNKSAGYDFKSPIAFTILPGNVFKLFTNIKVFMQDDEYLEIHIRSSIGMKKNLRMKNCIAIIDADYFSNEKNDGNIILCLLNEGKEAVVIFKGERIAQGIFKKYLITDDDTPI